ncbi:MAG: extracellular solute-binding protein [Chloroflexi bacterium]|nr:extracellular solute-binding protein [Chloroflexota bacterium]
MKLKEPTLRSHASDGFLTRRRLLGVAGLAGLGSLVAACMPAAQPPAPTKAAETKPAEAKPAATVAPAAAPASSKAPVELVFWTFMPTAARFAGRPELFKRWGDKANATVKVEELDNNDIHTKLLAGKASGVLPDILDPAESPRVNNWAQIGVLADVSRVLKELGQDDFWKPAVDAVSFDGKIWSIPFVGFPHLLYYRKDMLTEKGLKPPTNWDEMEQVAKALTGKDKAGQEISGTVGFFAIHHALFFWQNMVGPNNGFTWDKADKEKPMFPAKENLEAMNYVKRLVPYMQKGAESMNYGNTNTFFFEGKCATTLSSTSFANGLYKTKPELAPNVGSAPVPKGPSSDGKRGAANGVSY